MCNQVSCYGILAALNFGFLSHQKDQKPVAVPREGNKKFSRRLIINAIISSVKIPPAGGNENSMAKIADGIKMVAFPCLSCLHCTFLTSLLHI